MAKRHKETKGKPKVTRTFVSYARPQEKIAKELTDQLKRKGITVDWTEGEIDQESSRRLSKYFKDGAIDKLREKGTPEKLAFLREIAAESGVAPLLIAPPTQPPELWADRDKSKQESPAQFIARVYARYLGKGLILPDINDLDRQLYRAYTALSPVGGVKPAGFDLPSREEWNDRVLANPYLFVQLSSEARVRLARTLSMRAQKQKTLSK